MQDCGKSQGSAISRSWTCSTRHLLTDSVNNVADNRGTSFSLGAGTVYASSDSHCPENSFLLERFAQPGSERPCVSLDLGLPGRSETVAGQSKSSKLLLGSNPERSGGAVSEWPGSQESGSAFTREGITQVLQERKEPFDGQDSPRTPFILAAYQSISLGDDEFGPNGR